MASQIFSTVPVNVLIRIFTLVEEAHPSTLYSLLFIKSTKPSAEMLIYRRVSICGPTPLSSEHWPAHKSLLKRILNPLDNLNSLIRELAILHWPGPGSPDFGVDLLENVLESIKELLVFKWESQVHIPPAVLSKFHTLFPAALLEVTNRGRGRLYSHIDLDLLRSPQLHCLDLVVLQTNLSSYGLDRQISEFPVLKQILQRSPNLRVLKLGYYQQQCYQIGNLYQKWHSEYKTDGDGPLNLQFQNKDSFPTLVELGIIKERFHGREQGYDMNMAHCIAWKKAMNWKSLSKIDLGNALPNDFFRVFRGHIPQLKSLKFRLSRGLEAKDDPAPLLVTTKRFLDSIKALDELVIEDWTRSFFVDLWLSIQGRGQTLRSLEVNPSVASSNNAAGWASKPLMQLLEGIPRLTTLALAVDLSKSETYWDSRHPLTWPNKPFSILCSFSVIDSLQIRIRLPPGGNAPPDINRRAVSKLTTDLFKGFFEHDIASRLMYLNLQVQREETHYFEGGTCAVAVEVKRLVRDDAPSPLEGGFEVKINDDFDGF